MRVVDAVEDNLDIVGEIPAGDADITTGRGAEREKKKLRGFSTTRELLRYV